MSAIRIGACSAAIATLLALAPAAWADDGAGGKGGRKDGGKADHLARLDTDGDGKISREEAKAAAKLDQSFDRLDANGDGFLTREEIRAAAKDRRGKKDKGGQPGQPGQPGKPDRRKGDKGDKGGDRKNPLAGLDKNGDGSISAEEARGTKLEAHFDRLDTNGDGLLSREELKGARGDKRGKGKGQGKGGTSGAL